MGTVTGLVLVLAVTLHLAGSTTQLARLASKSICGLAGHSSEHADLWFQRRLSSLNPTPRQQIIEALHRMFRDAGQHVGGSASHRVIVAID